MAMTMDRWDTIEEIFTKAKEIMAGNIEMKFTGEEYTRFYRSVFALCTKTPGTYSESQIVFDKCKGFMEECITCTMGSRFKKAVIAENIRGSLHGWLKRVKDKSRHDSHHLNLTTTRSNTSLESMAEEMDEPDNPSSGTVSGVELVPIMQEPTFVISDEIYEQPEGDDSLEVLHCSDPIYDNSDDGGDDGNGDCDDHVRNESCLLPPSRNV